MAIALARQVAIEEHELARTGTQHQGLEEHGDHGDVLEGALT